jgi:hypothetical protein
MSTEALGWWLFGVQAAAYVALCYVYPFRYMLRSGRFGRGVLLCWIAAAVFSFCSLILGQYLGWRVDRVLANYCCEGPQFLAFAILGWCQGLIIAGIASVIFRRRSGLKEKQQGATIGNP